MRKIKSWWLNHNTSDLGGAVLGVVAYFLPDPVLGQASVFAAAGSAVIAIMAALATFGCGAIYQSTAPMAKRIRDRFGRSLQRAWVWVISIILLCALVSLAGIAVAPLSPVWAWVLALGSLGVAAVATWRVVVYIGFTLTAEAIDPTP